MPKPIRMRARMDNEITAVKAIISHPMETGRRRDKTTDQIVPAHFIQKVIGEYKGKVVFEAHWGTGISKNPFVSFAFKGAQKGDTVKLSWFDNMGNSENAETTIK